MTGSDPPPIVAVVAELLARDSPVADAASPLGSAAEGGTVVEVGIGDRHDAARALANAGHDVIAIDVTERDVPSGVRFIQADVHALADGSASLIDGSTSPVDGAATTADDRGDDPSTPAVGDPSTPAVDVVYARNLPAEIQPAAARFAGRIDAPLAFTTLGFEVPSPSLPPTLVRRSAGSETVFVLAD
ncbi:UPF0146 family protein [Halopenitus persicus]|uniref:UPF0146 family protein n=1 Tax=Halopenitus persicus TaxID=1048396 RepID=UPI000BBABC05|nr:UPF0146 family protein [Halopenitus persicus]